MKTKPKAPTPPDFADNQSQAACLLGITVAEVRAAKAAGCPAFRSGRIYTNTLREWLRTNEVDAAPENVRDRFFLAKAQREELALARERGEFLPRNEVAQANARCMALFFAELERAFEMELPAEGKGLDEVGIRNLSREKVQALKDRFRERLDELQKEPNGN